MLRLTTLGALDLRDRHGHAIRDVLAQPKRVALLVYLVMEGARGPVSRDRLLGLFWPESDTARARNALSQALHALRRGLGADLIESQGATTIQVRPGELWCDAVALGAAIEGGEAEMVLDLYRGEFCPTLFLSGAPDVEQWIDQQRRRLRRLALASARTHAERLSGRGDLEGAARTARRALAMQPDDETDVRTLLGVLERSGDIAGAQYAYQEYRRRLSAELELEPAPETRRLVDEMRRRREAATASFAPLSPPAAAAPPARRSAPWLLPRGAALAVGVVLMVALAAAALATRSRTPLSADAARRLAVFPFVLHGGASHAYLGEGMVDLLSTKLDGAGGFQAIDPRSVVAAVPPDSAGIDPVTIEKAARHLGAGWYVSGEVVELAGRLQLSALLYDRSNPASPAARASVSGDTAAVFSLVDDLAGRILAGLTRGRDSNLTRLAAVTTHSLPALKAFLVGEQAMRAGHDAQAAAAFREAATLDTGFALAEYRLALSATWIMVPGAEDPSFWAARAARHAARLPPLARDLLAAYDAYKGLDADSAEHLYLSLTAAHPDNVEAWFMLAETRFHYGPWQGRSQREAWPAFERVLALDPGNAHAMIHLARLAAAYGWYDRLDSLVGRYLDRYSGAERTAEMRALQAFARNDPAAIARISRELEGSDPVVATSVLQAVVLVVQDLELGAVLAERVLPTIRQKRIEQILRRMTTDLPLAAGQWAPEARGSSVRTDDRWGTESSVMVAGDPFFQLPRARVEEVRGRLRGDSTFVPQIHLEGRVSAATAVQVRDYHLGLLSLRAGDAASAERILSELERSAREPGDLATDLLHALRAELARSRGDNTAALAELERFTFDPYGPQRPGLSHWGIRERFLRAELLTSLGRYEEALPWYESFVGLYDTPYMAPAQFRMGEIYRRLGNVERARFHLGRFVTMWKDSDPAVRPRVDQAREWLDTAVD